MEADRREFLLRRQLVLEDSSVGDVAHCFGHFCVKSNERSYALSVKENIAGVSNEK
jgi:hypothetical protein